MRPALRLAFAAALAVLFAVSWPQTEAAAQDWTRESNYPSRVAAIRYENGAAITGSSSVTFGAWSISFGNALPVATHGYADEDQEVPYIQITGLVCSNSVTGKDACKMGVFFRKHYCRIDGEGDKKGPGGLQIKCPAALELTR